MERTLTDGKPKGVVLLSGGLDSATAAAVARERGSDVYALTLRYGQRHAIEAEAAARVAKALQVAQHVYQTIDLRTFGGSALTDSIEVPKSTGVSRASPASASRTSGAASDLSRGETARAEARGSACDFEGRAKIGRGIPVTYVPARNTILLAFALAYAETIGSSDIFIGVNAVDYSGYPDCRPAFVEQFERLANVATKAGAEGVRFKVHAPLIAMSKAQIIREGLRLGVDFGLTHSCYDPTPEGLACGMCESCLLRREGFKQAGIEDPIRYAPPRAAGWHG